MRKCLVLLLLSTLQIFSEEFIENFFTEGRTFQPAANEFIQKAGNSFTSFPKLPNYLSDNELFMRVRYSYDRYRLFKGQFKNSHSAITPVFHFAYPKDMTPDEFSRIRFYSAVNAQSDIPVVYFSKGGMHVEVASVLFYKRGDAWKKIVAENTDDAKSLQIKTGTLAVTSKPAGIPIYIDGQSTGLRTPNYLQNIVVGTHMIELKDDDYQSIQKSVQVVEDDYVSVNCTLSTIKNRIVLEGTPIGAEVRLNGVMVGKLPLSIPDLRSGTYRVDISKELYHDESYNISVASNGFDTVYVQLKEQFGRLILPTLEEGEWYINKSNVVAGEQQLPAGKHLIAYRGYGKYETFDTVITISDGEKIEPRFRFSKPEGELEVLPFPMSAEVFINGKSYGFGPQRVTLPVGTYEVVCSSIGHETRKVTKSVKRGEYAVVKAMLREKRAPIAERIVTNKSYRKVVTAPKKTIRHATLSGTYVVFSVGGAAINPVESHSITQQIRSNHGRLGAHVLSETEMKRAFLDNGYFAVTIFNRDEAIKYGKLLNADFAVFGRVIRDSQNSEPYLITQTINLKTYETVSRKTQKWESRESGFEQVAYNVQ